MSSTVALVPSVKLGGNALPADWLAALIDLRVEAVFQAPSRATLRFVDPSYTLASSGSAAPATALQVLDATTPSLVLFSGEITAVGVEQRVGEQPELVVVAYDKSHRLGRQTTARSFSNSTYSDAVSSLASDADLSTSVTATSATVPYFMQADSDLGMLTELARRVGYDWWVSGTTLNFAPPAAGATVTLTLGANLLSFSARANAQPPTEVNIAGWDSASQDVVVGQATSPTGAVTASSTVADLASGRSSTLGQATLFSAGLGVASTAEANTVSSALLDRFAAGAVRASGVATGNGAIALGATANVVDAGPLSGTYPITRVEHVYRARTGYVTRFWSGDRVPTTLVDTLSAAATPQATFHQTGLTVGVVTSINDPNKTGMVQVLYPGLGAQYATGWARVVAVGGGATRGGVFVPEVSDEVLIGFECADPRRPVVIGGLYGAKSTIPTPTIADGKVETRTITSRLGHVISLLDGTATAEQAIELTLAGGQTKLHLGKDQVTLTIPSGIALTISAGSSTSIAFGTDGAVSIKAPQITLQATEKLAVSAPQVQVSADSQLQLSGQAQASLEGGTVSVQGSGPVSIQGALVQING